MPSSCNVEPSYVKTFDGKYYNYAINNCEHVVFAEESTRPRVVVTTQNTQQKQIVKLIVDGEKYEVETPKETRHYRGVKASIKINGEEKETMLPSTRMEFTLSTLPSMVLRFLLMVKE